MYLYVSDSLYKQSPPLINYYKFVKSEADTAEM